ncbi:hypothetical protein [Phreatobacter oligotrophus]|uniref:Uncharacterized protein n=1 Tax=Phreatobacter oligotrophus TaxID=1122261 RepID=A0A2T4Z1J2_9HYPH|nr:hypothetical protein [Phreatobacter oligotrophus]PTM53593.1 hypothetical protein C8P69_106247 [Phreatobacter oligotrophus]
MMRFAAIFAAAIGVAGCVTTDTVRFSAGQGQTAMHRDGRPAVSSVQRNTIALLTRVGREIPQGGRVGYVLAVQNRSGAPVEFAIENVDVVQTIPGRPDHRINVISFEQAMQEERNRQIAAAILVGVAAGANAAAASRAGYYRQNTTIYTPRGVYSGVTTGYSPGLAMAASANAAVQNQAMVNAAVEQGQANMANLEAQYIKNHTIMPGEWYGGRFGIEPPVSDTSTASKTYRLSVRVGADVHTFDVVQEPTRR